MLNGSELSVLSSMLSILRPLEAANNEISGDKYCTGSKIISFSALLSPKNWTSNLEDSLAIGLKSFVLEEIEKRMGAIERVQTPLAIATYLYWIPGIKKILQGRTCLICSSRENQRPHEKCYTGHRNVKIRFWSIRKTRRKLLLMR